MQYNSSMKKQPTSFRLSPLGIRLLRLLSKKLGISQASVLEMLIREKAESEHLLVQRDKE